MPSKKQVEKKNRDDLLKRANVSMEYKKIIDAFPDAKLIEIDEDIKNDWF